MATYRWAEGLDKHCSSGLGCIWSTHSLWNESLQAFKTSFLHPPAPLFLHEAPGSMGEPADYQEFPNAACREEWKLVGNGLRVTVLSMEGRCGQESLRQTGKYNPDGGVPLCQHSSGQERERQTQTDRQTDREGGREGEEEGERWYYSVCFPLLNGVWKPGHTFSMKHNLSGFGNLNSFKLSRCPFPIS